VADSVPDVSELREIGSLKGTQALVLLGSQTPPAVTKAAQAIRKVWPHSKIVLLFENMNANDCQKLIETEVDGCVPLFASRQVLMSTLELVIFDQVRIIVLAGAPASRHVAAPEQGNAEFITIETNGSTAGIPAGETPCPLTPETASVAGAPAALLPRPFVSTATSSRLGGVDHTNGGVAVGGHVTERSGRNLPKLSSREWQILDGLVKGNANKVIARDCNITEATVKVHMKSILRKIRVGNRTQAAVWALANGSTPEDLHDRLSQAVSDQ
jgi:two-component system nitrate/nitrite response regulator NarL